MALELSRRSMLRLVGTAGAAGLTVGVVAPPTAEAALTVTDAVIDFGHNTDVLRLRAELEGPVASGNVGDFMIRVEVFDNRTGEVHSWFGSPTVVR